MRHTVLGLGEVGVHILYCLDRAKKLARGLDIKNGDTPETMSDQDLPYWMHVCIPCKDVTSFVEATLPWIKPSCEMVIIHSSVPVGTTDALASAIKAQVVHSPVNGKHIPDRVGGDYSNMLEYITHLPKFVGGPPSAVGRVAIELGNVWKIRKVGSAKASEMLKLLATTYYGMTIVWSQLVDTISRDIGVSYDDLFAVFSEIDSEDWKVGRRFPGKLAGHCIGPNLKLLQDCYPHPLWDLLLKMNEEYEP